MGVLEQMGFGGRGETNLNEWPRVVKRNVKHILIHRKKNVYQLLLLI
jgi:hypothetical protein